MFSNNLNSKIVSFSRSNRVYDLCNLVLEVVASALEHCIDQTLRLQLKKDIFDSKTRYNILSFVQLKMVEQFFCAWTWLYWSEGYL